MIGTERDHTAYVAAHTFHGAVLEHLAHLIEQHHCHSLGILAYDEGTYRSQCHKHELIEHIAVRGMLHRRAHHSRTHRQKSYYIPHKCDGTFETRHIKSAGYKSGDKHYGRHHDWP